MLAKINFQASAAHFDATSSKLTEVRDFGDNPGALRMFLYIPAALAPGSPLVVVLHGANQSARDYAEGSGWLCLADKYGFAVLCPEQTLLNNAMRAFNWFEPSDTTRGTGEAASIQCMVLSTIAEYQLAPDLVFITGLSSGGAMAAVMLATYPEIFVGGAPVAGLAFGSAHSAWGAISAMSQGNHLLGNEWGDKVRSASEHQGRWPTVSIWHGDNDRTVRLGAADELVSQWTNVHGTVVSPIKFKTHAGRPYCVWQSKAGHNVVELHVIAGMSHGTPLNTRGPDGCGKAGSYLLETGISSSTEIAHTWGLSPDQLTCDPRSLPDLGKRPQTLLRRARRLVGLEKAAS